MIRTSETWRQETRGNIRQAAGLAAVSIGVVDAPPAPGAFSEDPKASGKALTFVALGEGVALYGLLISILIINNL